MTEALVVTSGRADWGKLGPVVTRLVRDYDLWVRVLAVGGHHLDSQGDTFGQVLADIGDEGRIAIAWERTHVEGEPAADIARTAEAVARRLREDRPRCLIVHGDRLEAAAAAQAAWARGTPIVHVEAGERTGSTDDGWSRTITVHARLALCAAAPHVREAMALMRPNGEVGLTGCPGYDMLAAIAEDPPCKNGTAIVLAHPDACRPDPSAPVRRTLDIARHLSPDLDVYGWWPNHDPGARPAVRAIRMWRQEAGEILWHKDVPRPVFLRMLAQARVIIGNSSCGLREAGALRTWCVDIGTRQGQRTPCGPHVLRPPDDETAERVGAAVLGAALTSNPPDPWWGYGPNDGRCAARCAARIAHFLAAR